MEERSLHLTDALFEFQTLENLLKDAQRGEFHLDDATVPLLMLLAGVTWKKLHYYQDKYNLMIPSADVCFVHELANHIDFSRATGPDYIDGGVTVDVPAEVANHDMLKLAETILKKAKEEQRYKLMEAITTIWADQKEAPTDQGGQ